MPRPLSSLVLVSALLGAPALIGCSGRPTLPPTTGSAYQGPALALDSSQGEYGVVIQAPSPGWEVTLDRVAEQYRHNAAFITLRRPNPGYMYPQVIVEQRVSTSVPTTTAIKVYARVVEHDARRSQREYSLAAQAESVRKRR